MEFLSYIPGSWYSSIYNYLVFGLCLIMVLRNITAEDNQLIYQKVTLPVPALALSLLLIIFLGMRPEQQLWMFGDSFIYQHTYNNIVTGYTEANTETEWIFRNLMFFCKGIGLDINGFFVVVDAFYFGLMLFCCWKLFPNNTWIAFLFFISSFSCYSFAINGIRNGLATSMLLFAIALISDDDYKKYIAFGIMLLALGVHRSTILPSAACIASIYVLKEPKYAIGFWIASIFISLVAGNAIGNFFASLGFDDRMSNYFQGQQDAETMSEFSDNGFRFDFLLYSAMPVLMAWYVTVKRNFKDRAFNIIANTYILANAFWVMVIRASYSNRFAYLSWFIYPLVIAYPLLRMNIWEDQDRKTAQILLAYSGFTFFMFLIGK